MTAERKRATAAPGIVYALRRQPLAGGPGLAAGLTALIERQTSPHPAGGVATRRRDALQRRVLPVEGFAESIQLG